MIQIRPCFQINRNKQGRAKMFREYQFYMNQTQFIQEEAYDYFNKYHSDVSTIIISTTIKNGIMINHENRDKTLFLYIEYTIRISFYAFFISYCFQNKIKRNFLFFKYHFCSYKNTT